MDFLKENWVMGQSIQLKNVGHFAEKIMWKVVF